VARLVLIAEGTVREDTQVGDIVSVHDDDVVLSGAGYENFTILDVPGISAKEVSELMVSIAPKVSMAFRLNTTPAGTWTLEQPEEKEVWQNPSDAKWYFVEEPPKFRVTVKQASLDPSTIDTLSNPKVSPKDKLQTLQGLIAHTYGRNSANLTEAKDLNT